MNCYPNEFFPLLPQLSPFGGVCTLPAVAVSCLGRIPQPVPILAKWRDAAWEPWGCRRVSQRYALLLSLFIHHFLTALRIMQTLLTFTLKVAAPSVLEE